MSQGLEYSLFTAGIQGCRAVSSPSQLCPSTLPQSQRVQWKGDANVSSVVLEFILSLASGWRSGQVGSRSSGDGE